MTKTSNRSVQRKSDVTGALLLLLWKTFGNTHVFCK